MTLAMNHQALTQKKASTHKSSDENNKFSMRVWMNRMGLTGDEFKSVRMHMLKNLSGDSAWGFRTAA